MAFQAKAEAISSEVVGYNTDTGKGTQFNMSSVPFIGVDGDGWQLNSCLSGDMTAGTTAETGDYIQIWDPTMEFVQFSG